MQTTIKFTARKKFDPVFHALDWEGYINWSGLTHLTEVVSLDGVLNGQVLESDFETALDDIIFDEHAAMLFFKSLEYLIQNLDNPDHYNILAVIKEPGGAKQRQLENDFDFIGYDLIEKNGNTSALTNCGGFDETFLPTALNQYGLISDYERAKEIQGSLPKNNPGEVHADCFLYEIWRYKMIGRAASR